jgi:hypothetical protein
MEPFVFSAGTIMQANMEFATTTAHYIEDEKS